MTRYLRADLRSTNSPRVRIYIYSSILKKRYFSDKIYFFFSFVVFLIWGIYFLLLLLAGLKFRKL